MYKGHISGTIWSPSHPWNATILHSLLKKRGNHELPGLLLPGFMYKGHSRGKICLHSLLRKWGNHELPGLSLPGFMYKGHSRGTIWSPSHPWHATILQLTPKNSNNARSLTDIILFVTAMESLAFDLRGEPPASPCVLAMFALPYLTWDESDLQPILGFLQFYCSLF